MKPRILLLLLCELATTMLFAQTENNKILRGKVLFQNSNFTPAEAVEVSGVIKVEREEYANKVNTDSKGQYELKFPLARKGHPVKLTIGNTDKTGQELEVVNEKELQLCRIPANASQEFEIIVCPKGARDIAARKYYKIIKNSAELAYQQMQEQFRALTKAQNKDYKTIQQVADDLTKLQTQLNDSIALYKEAMAIASINKDGVNERVINYLKLLDEGKSVQEARKELSISKAAKEMEKGITLFRAGVKELEERARASAAVFDYKDAIVCYDTLIAKAEKLNVDRMELGEYYLTLGSLYQDNGQYHKALQNKEKAVNILEKELDSLEVNLATGYNNLAISWMDLGHYQKALTYQQKALKIQEKTLDDCDRCLMTSYNNLSLIYKDLGRYHEALTLQKKVIKNRKNVLGPNHLEVASSYNNLAGIYNSLNQYQEALINQQQALKIEKSILEPFHPILATSYNNLSMMYKDLGYYEQAITFQQKALSILKMVFEPNHPYIASSYSNLASIYYYLGQNNDALVAGQKAIQIRQAVLEPMHPDLALSYHNMALVYTALGYYKKAFSVQKKALKIRKALAPHHPNLAHSYDVLASIYQYSGDYEKALTAQQKAIDILEFKLDTKNPDLGIFYRRLSVIYFQINDLSNSVYFLQKAYEHLKKSIPNASLIKKQTFKDLLIVHKEYGIQLFLEGNYKEALKSLDTFTKYQKDLESFNYKGMCHYYLKQYPKAITSYNAGLAIDGSFKELNYYNNLGTAYVKNLQFAKAKKAFIKYQKLYPNNGRVYRNWAMYYALQNKKENALENLEKAIALGYIDLKWLQTDDSMNSLRNEPRFIALLERLKE